MFIVVMVVACLLSWQAYRARQETIAVAELKELGITVVYGTRKPQWLWGLGGDRLGRTAVSANAITPENLEAAIPYLKALHNLKEVTVAKYPVPNHANKQYEQQLDAVRAKLRRAMPGLDVWLTVGSGSIPDLETDMND
jgi:hypothetical protein